MTRTSTMRRLAATLLVPMVAASGQGNDPNLRRLESEIGRLSTISGGKVGVGIDRENWRSDAKS